MSIENVIAELEEIQKHLNAGYSFAITWKSKIILDTIKLLKEFQRYKQYEDDRVC